ncbi:NAD-dependent epimerase/dehydratase family protein [Psychroflexus maritimus]|uniref:NAD-dependent epimerase/dehydratase family protein n=1 Tax=Psychroflexus maritimus TaxID=2714865 RepID=A0A967AL27_9FLAO|nr:NAD-dependent epimerase/dehydratase family protein [Psychroflexus maritimus]NGZ90269.1 NAD-dependent epimerase/dehydratase family protein [Psychroflexus maritimus]
MNYQNFQRLELTEFCQNAQGVLFSWQPAVDFADYTISLTENLQSNRKHYRLVEQFESSATSVAMIRKFHEAKVSSSKSETPLGGAGGNSTVNLWGSGTPMREFLHVDDLAEAVSFALEHKLEENLYNIGTGKDLTIKELAETIQEIVGHKGEIIWDSSKPDGTPRKLMDVSKMNAQGWEAKIDLKEGIKETYKWFLVKEREFKEVKIKSSNL